jgi:RNA polymerase sigma factor (TIGR02999 family)
MLLEQIEPPAGDVTRLLNAARDGDAGAMDRLIAIVYDDLRAIAKRQLRRELGSRVQPTSLVHRAYMKLARGVATYAGGRAHFFAIAARAMRQVLVDDARRRSVAKRAGEVVTTSIAEVEGPGDIDADDLFALNEAIETLEPRQRQVVECRFFGGMDEREIAAALAVTERTVRRDWVKARAWLYRSLYGVSPD